MSSFKVLLASALLGALPAQSSEALPAEVKTGSQLAETASVDPGSRAPEPHTALLAGLGGLVLLLVAMRRK